MLPSTYLDAVVLNFGPKNPEIRHILHEQFSLDWGEASNDAGERFRELSLLLMTRICCQLLLTFARNKARHSFNHAFYEVKCFTDLKIETKKYEFRIMN